MNKTGLSSNNKSSRGEELSIEEAKREEQEKLINEELKAIKITPGTSFVSP
jgi:hypothetical protein